MVVTYRHVQNLIGVQPTAEQLVRVIFWLPAALLRPVQLGTWSVRLVVQCRSPHLAIITCRSVDSRGGYKNVQNLIGTAEQLVRFIFWLPAALLRPVQLGT